MDRDDASVTWREPGLHVQAAECFNCVRFALLVTNMSGPLEAQFFQLELQRNFP